VTRFRRPGRDLSSLAAIFEADPRVCGALSPLCRTRPPIIMGKGSFLLEQIVFSMEPLSPSHAGRFPRVLAGPLSIWAGSFLRSKSFFLAPPVVLFPVVHAGLLGPKFGRPIRPSGAGGSSKRGAGASRRKKELRALFRRRRPRGPSPADRSIDRSIDRPRGCRRVASGARRVLPRARMRARAPAGVLAYTPGDSLAGCIDVPWWAPPRTPAPSRRQCEGFYGFGKA
jgi:hypothetical protein